MKLLMLCALLCVVALTRAAEKGEDEHVQQPGKDVSHLEKRFLWRCSGGWTKYGGRCFHFVPGPLTWNEAEKNCQAMSGHLASLRNKEEYFWLQHLIATKINNYPLLWIGGSTRKTNTAWFWSDGTTFTFTFWCKGKPNNTGTQHCLQMNHSDNKCWNDYQCDGKRPFVCVKESKFLG